MSSYTPPSWLRNQHIQTLWPPLFRRQRPLSTRRERVDLPDSDFLDLDWFAENNDPEQPLVVLFHGLTGSSQSQYILGMQAALAAQQTRHHMVVYESTAHDHGIVGNGHGTRSGK